MYAKWVINEYDISFAITGKGSANPSTFKVSYAGSVEFTLTPTLGYYLESFSCSAGYTLSSFSTGKTATSAQKITITNSSVETGGVCSAVFKPSCEYADGYTWTFNYKNEAQKFVVPCKGTYKIEAYGASGGGHTASMVGSGGYTSATTLLEKDFEMFAYVGQQGTYKRGNGDPDDPGYTTTYEPATFNGGGDGGSLMTVRGWHVGGSGGGASDIRLVSGAWNNLAGLKSRVLVAGGGGGCGCASAHNPGHGGGLVAPTTLNIASSHYAGASASGGSQTAGGRAIGKWTNNGASTGSFGVGANAAQCAAGAGGGYYGGGTEYTAGGSGGSSYVKGCAGCDKTYTASQGNITFSNIVMEQGKNVGNGKIVITLQESVK